MTPRNSPVRVNRADVVNGEQPPAQTAMTPVHNSPAGSCSPPSRDRATTLPSALQSAGVSQ